MRKCKNVIRSPRKRDKTSFFIRFTATKKILQTKERKDGALNNSENKISAEELSERKKAEQQQSGGVLTAQERVYDFQSGVI